MIEVVRKAIDEVLYVVNTASWLVEQTLTINYHVMSYIVAFISNFSFRVWEGLNLIRYTVGCLLEDFVVFLTDISSIVKSVSDFALGTYDLISAVLSGIIGGFAYFILGVQKLCSFFVLAAYACWNIILQLFWGIHYATLLIASSIVLLLQLIPQLCILFIASIYNACKQCVVSIIDTIQNANAKICQHANNAFVSIVTSIQNIPIDALVGLVLGILIVIIMRKVVFYVCKRSVQAIALRLLVSVLNNIASVTVNSYHGCRAKMHAVYRKVRREFEAINDADDDMQGEVVYRLARQPPNPRGECSKSSNKTGSGKKCYCCGDFMDAAGPVCERCVAKRLEEELQTEREVRVCVVCQDTTRTILLLPCRHLCLCRTCLDMILEHNGNCPVCRQHIIHAIPVYM